MERYTRLCHSSADHRIIAHYNEN